MIKLGALERHTLIPASDDAPEVWAEFEPVNRRLWRSCVRKVLGMEPTPTQEADAFAAIEQGDELSCELIRRTLRRWGGIGDKEGAVADVTTENVELFLANDQLFKAADQAVVMPFVQRGLEGNASGASPVGTSEADPNIADPAGATPPSTDTAAPIPPAAETPAPTSPTRRGRTKAETSGT